MFERMRKVMLSYKSRYEMLRIVDTSEMGLSNFKESGRDTSASKSLPATTNMSAKTQNLQNPRPGPKCSGCIYET
jgi:hypothetical protein